MTRLRRQGSTKVMRWGWAWAGAALLLMVTGATGPTMSSARAEAAVSQRQVQQQWQVRRLGTTLQIGFGTNRNAPQYAALHLDSSYLRMINSTHAGWGTSLILLPALWSRTSCPRVYCQGAPVTAQWRSQGADLRLSVHGTIATLKVEVIVVLTPPARGVMTARISARTAGAVRLDPGHPWDAFKPVMLSSMHESPTVWDARAAFAGTRVHQLPSNGWIIKPPTLTKSFGLYGGTSTWKKSAPTLHVVHSRPCLVTGWVTRSRNPNDDNVGYWCATTSVLRSWNYVVSAR